MRDQWYNNIIHFGQTLLTRGADCPGPGQVGLVGRDDDRLLLGVVLRPQIVEDLLGDAERVAVHD